MDFSELLSCEGCGTSASPPKDEYCLGLGMTSNLSLNKIVPLHPDVFKEGHDVDGVLVSHLFQHAVQHYVGARPSHSGAVEHK